MQVVIEKLQAGAQKAQEVARKLETPAPSAEGVEALVSLPYHNLLCLVPTACYMPLPPYSSTVDRAAHQPADCAGMIVYYGFIFNVLTCLLSLYVYAWQDNAVLSQQGGPSLQHARLCSAQLCHFVCAH